MKLQLSMGNSGYLMPDTEAELKEWDISENELIDFRMGLLKLSLNGDILIKERVDSEKENEIKTNISKIEKKQAIEKIATFTDQLNLTAGTLDIIVDLLAINNPELLTNPWVIESKSKLNDIKNILNK